MADLMPTIIIDTREQNPLPFSLPTERGTLALEGYPLKGLEQFVAVERKNDQGELSHDQVKNLTNSTGT